MSTHADHEAYLRAALHAAADSLEPGGDGLERIRTRLARPRPSVVVWMVAARDELRFRAPAAMQDAIYRVAAELRAAAERFAPVQTPGKHRSRTEGWLRPLAAMAAVMFIVAAGTYVAIDASTAVSPSSSSSHPRSGGQGPAGHAGGAADGESPFRSSGAPGSAASPSASPTCTAKTSPQPSPSAPSSPSPSPSPSASSSPSPSASPSDSPSDGSSPDAVSAVRLTAYVIAAAPCASKSPSQATPAASTDAGVTEDFGEPVLIATSAGLAPISASAASARRQSRHL